MYMQHECCAQCIFIVFSGATGPYRATRRGVRMGSGVGLDGESVTRKRLSDTNERALSLAIRVDCKMDETNLLMLCARTATIAQADPLIGPMRSVVLRLRDLSEGMEGMGFKKLF